MHAEVPSNGIHIEELRLSKSGTGALGELFSVILVQGMIIRLNNCSLKDTEFVNSSDPFPVNRFLEPPAIVNHHDDNGPAVQARPLDCRAGFLFKIKVIQLVLDTLLCGFVIQPKLKAMLYDFF